MAFMTEQELAKSKVKGKTTALFRSQICDPNFA
jgi:hypothetical protein